MNLESLLKEIREKAGETSAEMAKKLGITEEKLGKMEKGISKASTDLVKKVREEYQDIMGKDFFKKESLEKLIPDVKDKIKDVKDEAESKLKAGIDKFKK